MEKQSRFSYSLALFLLCMIFIGSYRGVEAKRTKNRIIPIQYVLEHNKARANVGVPPIKWDRRLAKLAQTWANKCIWEHGMPLNNYPIRTLGQNLAAAAWDSISAKEVLRMFVDEKKHYHYESNTCDPNEMCGHYTQVVWRNTTRVGCAKSPPLCTTDGMTMVVCNYAPAGNYLGIRPY